jgi:hypothetical protein
MPTNKNCVGYLLMLMLCKYKFWVLFFVSLFLSVYSAGATLFEDFSFQQNDETKPPLTLSGANIDNEKEDLSHDETYQVSVQVMNTRPYGVDGTVELSAFSLSEDPVVLGLETVELEPDTLATLSFTFSPGNFALPCTSYIFMVTTNPSSSAHISERDYIFVDGRHEFVFADCERAEVNDHSGEILYSDDISLSSQTVQNLSAQKDLSEKETDAVSKEETLDPLQFLDPLQLTELENEVEKTFEPVAPADLLLSDSDDVSDLPTDPLLNTDLDVNVANSELTD